MTKLFMVG